MTNPTGVGTIASARHGTIKRGVRFVQLFNGSYATGEGCGCRLRVNVAAARPPVPAFASLLSLTRVKGSVVPLRVSDLEQPDRKGRPRTPKASRS